MLAPSCQDNVGPQPYNENISQVARLLTPEVKARASAARKAARPRRKGYALCGKHGEPLQLVHRVRAEQLLGHPLPAGAVVHHINGDKSPDGPLMICANHAEHALLHYWMRIEQAGGDPNTEKICSRCKRVKPKTEFNINRAHLADGLDYFCRSCVREKNAVQTARRGGR